MKVYYNMNVFLLNYYSHLSLHFLELGRTTIITCKNKGLVVNLILN